MPLALRAHGLWKSYAAGVAGCSARVWVLRGASLEVQRGECVALIGARGAGTTTLLHCLAGLRRTDAGRIESALYPRLVDGSASAGTSVRDAHDELLLWDDRAPSVTGAPRNALAACQRGAGAVVIAAHDLAGVRQVADRVLLLRDGRLTPLDRGAGVRRVAERSGVR